MTSGSVPDQAVRLIAAPDETGRLRTQSRVRIWRAVTTLNVSGRFLFPGGGFIRFSGALLPMSQNPRRRAHNTLAICDCCRKPSLKLTTCAHRCEVLSIDDAMRVV